MKWFIALLAIIVIAVLVLLIYRSYLQRKILKKSKSETPPNGIRSVETIMIGGIKQSILIQADDQTKPVLLIVHGGPSMTAPGVAFRSVDYAVATTTKELIKHFVVVFWDQRGTGKSYSSNIPEESMNVKQFISDANEMVDYVRNRFNTQKIFLAGLSWGSILTLPLVAQYPEKFYAYIGLAQVVNWLECDKHSYQWALNHAKEINHQKAIIELTKVGAPPYKEGMKQWGPLRKWLLKFGGISYSNDQIQGPSMKYYVKTLFTSPDYTLRDIFGALIGGMKISYSKRMINDFGSFDYASSISKVDVPVYFFHGRHDKNVFGPLTEQYFHQLIAPNGKEFIWLEKSAHIFHEDDARIIETFMIETLVNHVQEKAS